MQSGRPFLYRSCAVNHRKVYQAKIRPLLLEIDSISKNRPTMLRRKNMKEDLYDIGRELIFNDSLVGTDVELEMSALVDKLIEDPLSCFSLYGNLIEILRVFRAAAEGSRVLITTSDENVGNEIKSAQIQKAAELYSVQVHRLRQLTVKDGWMLLLKAACLEQAKITPDLKKIGIGIVQKCNSLPLAIKAVGGVLARKSNRTEEWEGIHDSRAFSLKDPTTGTDGGVRSSIYLSYQDALPHLKQCFIYLSLFPVDFEIQKDIITQLWISEGLIDIRHGRSLEAATAGQNNVWQEESNRHNNSEGIAQEQEQYITLSRDSSDGRKSASLEVLVDDYNNTTSEQAKEHNPSSSQEIVEDYNLQTPKETLTLHEAKQRLNKQKHCSVEETADRYFKELTERGLLQLDNKTKGYKMHEQVRKIAESLTENEVRAGDPKDVARLSSTLHRLSFLNKGLTTIPEDVGRISSLRTLLLSGNPLSEKSLDIICNKLELLRVLDLSETEIISIPKTLGNLVHLRHLNLSHTRIKELPESIGSLRRLRFLGLQRYEYLTYLPKNIQKLPKLEYLNLRDCEITNPQRLQNLRHLTFLHGFVVDSISSNGWSLEWLQNMSSLTSLQIKIRKTLDRTPENGEMLKKKDNLRNLGLSCCTVNSETLSADQQERLQRVFTQLHPHQCLESLKIDGYYGTAFLAWLSFSELSNLQQLNLLNCMFCEELPPLSQLQRLKFLRIANFSKLKTVNMQPRAGTPSFPNLEELHIEDMQGLEYWSTFEDGDLPLLRNVSLKKCPKLKHLPGCLEHCKLLATMEVKEAVLLQVIENVFVQELLVEAMPSLITVSNLPLMKVFTIISCPILGKVSGVNSLRHIHMEDEQLGQLPKWLEQHAPRIETLDIVGKAELLGRCERNKEDWYIIRKIAPVYAYFPGRLSFFSYTRSNDFFCKYQRCRVHAHEDPSAPAADVNKSGASVLTSSGANNDSTSRPAQAHATDRKYMESKLVIALLIGLLHMFSLTSNLDRSEALYLLILYFIATCSLFKFL